jgi:pimeloyl-ACP methyl ester carboxylesterase
VGHGQVAVIGLHGWFGTADSWRTLAPYVDGDHFTYYFLDCRGYGSRRHDPGSYTLEEAASDAIATADELALERFALLGHSMGGAIMQQVLAQAPQRVSALVGVSPVPASGVPFDPDAWALFDGAANDPAKRRIILDLTTGNRLTDVWLNAAVEHSCLTSDAHAFAVYLNSWANTDFHQLIEGNGVPVKVIVGEHDPAVNEQVMRGTFERWYPNCTVEVLANAGHYAFDETPVALATAIERFLRSVE